MLIALSCTRSKVSIVKTASKALESVDCCWCEDRSNGDSQLTKEMERDCSIKNGAGGLSCRMVKVKGDSCQQFKMLSTPRGYRCVAQSLRLIEQGAESPLPLPRYSPCDRQMLKDIMPVLSAVSPPNLEGLTPKSSDNFCQCEPDGTSPNHCKLVQVIEGEYSEAGSVALKGYSSCDEEACRALFPLNVVNRCESFSTLSPRNN